MARRVSVLALALVAGLAGCGVPGNTGVTAERRGPDRGTLRSGSAQYKVPEPRDATTDEDFVRYFLQAAAGNFAGAPARLKAFLPTDTNWQPGSNAITIVRRESVSSLPLENRTKVDVLLRPVGRLTAAGTVEPIAEQAAITVTYTVVPVLTASKRTIVDAPTNVMYLDSEALTRLYTPYPIYFWDSAGTELIPDLRYLPLTIPEGDRPNEVVRWLLGGPSSWLLPVVTALPPGIELRDQPVFTPDGRLVVNLTAEARAVQDPDLLAIQLRWSLRDVYPGRVTLQIERQVKAESVDDSYVPYNRATLPKEQPEAYCIAGGVVAPIVYRGRAYCDVTGPVSAALAPQVNTGVVAAAMTRDHSRAALVRAAPNARFQLVVSQMLQNDKATVTTIGPSFAAIGRPAWLPPQPGAARGLIPIEGQLYEFAVERAPSLRVINTAGLKGITAVAVAPDGRRVALVASGRAYVATIGDRATDLDGPRLLSTTVDSVVGIGWSRQDRVVVGGFDADRHAPAVTEVTIDGAVEVPFTVPETLSISYLVASPASPIGGSRAPGSVMMEASGLAWAVFVTTPQQVLAATPASAPPGSSPTRFTAPFFTE